jgi:hypothetical protein
MGMKIPSTPSFLKRGRGDEEAIRRVDEGFGNFRQPEKGREYRNSLGGGAQGS